MLRSRRSRRRVLRARPEADSPRAFREAFIGEKYVQRAFLDRSRAHGKDPSEELFQSAAGVKFQAVPYRGASQAVTDLIGGQLDGLFGDVPTVMAQVKAGKLKALAVSTVKRSAAFPDVPTMQEAGVPDFEVDSWYAMLVPAKTPTPVVTKLNQLINQALDNPETQKAFLSIGLDVIHATPEQTEASILAEQNKWSELVRKIGLQLD